MHHSDLSLDELKKIYKYTLDLYTVYIVHTLRVLNYQLSQTKDTVSTYT